MQARNRERKRGELEFDLLAEERNDVLRVHHPGNDGQFADVLLQRQSGKTRAEFSSSSSSRRGWESGEGGERSVRVRKRAMETERGGVKVKCRLFLRANFTGASLRVNVPARELSVCRHRLFEGPRSRRWTHTRSGKK